MSNQPFCLFSKKSEVYSNARKTKTLQIQRKPKPRSFKFTNSSERKVLWEDIFSKHQGYHTSPFQFLCIAILGHFH